MTADPAPAGRTFWLARILLVLAVLVSAATAVMLGLLVYMVISGGNGPTSVTPSFPIAVLFFFVLGVPAIVISALLWAAYGAARTRGSRADAGPGAARGLITGWLAASAPALPWQYDCGGAATPGSCRALPRQRARWRVRPAPLPVQLF